MRGAGFRTRKVSERRKDRAPPVRDVMSRGARKRLYLFVGWIKRSESTRCQALDKDKEGPRFSDNERRKHAGVTVCSASCSGREATRSRTTPRASASLDGTLRRSYVRRMRRATSRGPRPATAGPVSSENRKPSLGKNPSGWRRMVATSRPGSNRPGRPHPAPGSASCGSRQGRP